MLPASFTLPSPAKLNLFLHITGQRDDGYHSLQTIFALLDWHDDLKFTTNENKGIRFSCDNNALNSDDNLVMKAARLLEAHTQSSFHVDLHLTKRLPMGGGIGGGSSNAATTLLGLNYLYDLELTEQTLLTLGAKIGADVPIFIKGRSCWAEGIGEQLSPINLPNNRYLVIHPRVHVSTATLFNHPNLTRNTPKQSPDRQWAQDGVNDFEPLVRALYPEIDNALLKAKTIGTPKLTGTGACVFLSFESQQLAIKAQKALTALLPEADITLCEGLAHSLTHTALGALPTSHH